jgi:CRP-like cAMP-binding protein
MYVKPMRELLAAAFGGLSPLPPETLTALERIARPRSFAAGDHLLRAGARAERVFVIAKGLVRELYVTADGDEHTRTFMAERQITGSLLDLLSGEPSVTWIEALEPTETLALPYRELDALCATHAALQLSARRAAEALYVKKARREYELLAFPAAERYRRFRAEQPGLDERISRRHLASYLGVTAEHLSRLRSR